MSKRVSAVLRDDDLVEWLESREESQAATIREGLRELRERERGSPVDHAGSEMDHAVDQSDPPVDQSDPAVDQLRARVADLEARVDGLDADQGGDDRGSDGDEFDELLADWRPGRDGEERQERRAAGRAALAWLREHGGRASGADFRAERGDAIPDVDEQSETTWWRRSVRPAVRCAVEAGRVEYREGHHDYQWIGEDETRDNSGQ